MDIESLFNYTSMLEKEYTSSFQNQMEEIWKTLNEIWTSLGSHDGKSDDPRNGLGPYIYGVEYVNDPSVDEYEVEMSLYPMFQFPNTVYENNKLVGHTSFTLNITSTIKITCPRCPNSNFTLPKYSELPTSHFTVDYNATNQSFGNFNISDYISVNSNPFEFPQVPSIDLPLTFAFPNIPTPLGILVTLDILLFIYRWYRTAGIIARVLRGKEVEVPRSTVSKEAKVKCCPSKFSTKDKVLSCIIWAHDRIWNLGYSVWKMVYIFCFIFQFFILVLFVYVLYFYVDEIINSEFIKQIGIFDLLTSGLGGQRAVRNEALATQALSYNSYSLAQLDASRQMYIDEKNKMGALWNSKESLDIERWNNYFCEAWENYIVEERDVTTDGLFLNFTGNATDFKYTLDGNTDTFWVPSKVFIDLELPEFSVSDEITSFWEISEIHFTWNFHFNNSLAFDETDYISFHFFSKLGRNDTYFPQTTDTNRYYGASHGKWNNLQIITFLDSKIKETRFIRIEFENTGMHREKTRIGAFELVELVIKGKIPMDNVGCPSIKFEYFNFDAETAVEMENCPTNKVTEVHGIMFRGFVRVWINSQLWEAHLLFLNALRNICLSPFYILSVAILIVFCGVLFLAILEWLLAKANMFRENPYTRVPLVRGFEEGEIEIEMETPGNTNRQTSIFGNRQGSVRL